MRTRAVVFDVGNVLYGWNIRTLYERLIGDDQALAVFLRDVVTPEWHFQHDAGRNFADTSAELIAQFPQWREEIAVFAERFDETITGPIPGMIELVEGLDARGVPLFAITNFSHEFWPPFRARRSDVFDRFRDIIVSGVELLVKPDPAIYRLALERFGITEGEGVFIDDRIDNVEAASANGFVGLHFTDVTRLRTELSAFGLLAADQGASQVRGEVSAM